MIVIGYRVEGVLQSDHVCSRRHIPDAIASTALIDGKRRRDEARGATADAALVFTAADDWTEELIELEDDAAVCAGADWTDELTEPESNALIGIDSDKRREMGLDSRRVGAAADAAEMSSSSSSSA